MPPATPYDDESSENDDPFALNTGYGQKSIDEMVNNAMHLERTSKASLKKLDPFGVAQSSRYSNKLAVSRFNQYRVSVINRNLKEPFTAEDLAQFMDSITKVIVVSRKRLVPGLYTILKHVNSIMKWARFQYPGISIHQPTIKAQVDRLIRLKRVSRGVARTRVWLGFTTMCRLAQTWLDQAVTKGTFSMDITILRLLAVVTCSSMGLRAGNAALSNTYRNEYLRLEHVRIYFADDAKDFTISDLCADVQLAYIKNHKSDISTPSVKYHAALSNDCAHVCFIRVLLIHALRQGLVNATTLDMVLQQAAARNDRSVVWLFPSYPLVCGIKSKTAFVDLTRPASAIFINQTIKMMGEAAGILSDVYAHALRMGYARDVAHLPNTLVGTVTTAVRESLNHNLNHAAGLGSKYAGGSSDNINSLREKNKDKVHRKEPQFVTAADLPQDPPASLSHKRMRLDDVDCQAFLTRHWPDGYGKQKAKIFAEMNANQKSAVRKTFRASKAKEDLESADVEAPNVRKSNRFREPLMPLPPNLPQPARLRQSSTNVSGLVPGSVPGSITTSSHPRTSGNANMHGSSNIDPTLLYAPGMADGAVSGSVPGSPPLDPLAAPLPPPITDGVVSGSVPDSLPSGPLADYDEAAYAECFAPPVNTIVDLIASGADDDFQDDGVQSADDEAELVRVVAAAFDDNDKGIDDQADTDLLDTRPSTVQSNGQTNFVTYFARYNICKIEAFGYQYAKFMQDPAQVRQFVAKQILAPIGGSRDAPIPWTYQCPTPACLRTFPCDHNLISHLLRCDPQYVEKYARLAVLPSLDCPYDGCLHVARNSEGRALNSLRKHIADTHDFQAVQCPIENCSTHPKQFTTASSLRTHVLSHDALDCPMPGCTFKGTRSNLGNHLGGPHKIADKAERDRLLGPKSTRAKYEPVRCGIDDCDTKPSIRKRHIEHLINIHGFTEDQAEAHLGPRNQAAPRNLREKYRLLESNDEDSEATYEFIAVTFGGSGTGIPSDGSDLSEHDDDDDISMVED
ncbi:Asparagine-rich zinc finger protein AZF1 [Elsinoe australis]|uniref:Asparagine-rich zinc finger protein AZF1 n=1 Tax=Elsinoe australis TaxID=40998 RepID=A0A2P8A7K2_9PEZI|nr:Asparagine-rich zinc finger protein AZF1 [Elsinoe australis]